MEETFGWAKEPKRAGGRTDEGCVRMDKRGRPGRRRRELGGLVEVESGRKRETGQRRKHR